MCNLHLIEHTLLGGSHADGQNLMIDPECCDGTDEYDGKIQCPNSCKEVAKAAQEEHHQAKKAAEKVPYTWLQSTKRCNEALTSHFCITGCCGVCI
jgi:hypothetical protein